MTDAAEWPNLATMFFAQSERLGERPFLWSKRDGTYAPLSWAQAARETAALARGLASLGIAPGDRVALVAENRPEWPIADIAIMAAGAITVPAYTTNSVADHLHVFRDSGAKGVIVSTRALADEVLPAAIQAPDMRFVVAIDDPRAAQSPGVDIHLWDNVLIDRDRAPGDAAERAATVTRQTTACLIYTSGTGGTPKGVMLSHGAILSNCEGARLTLQGVGLDNEVFLSFLPLSHSYEHTAGQYFPISIGAQIYYADGVDRLSANMIDARPTLMTAVPRLYEVMHDRIMRRMRHAGGRNARLFEWTVALGRRRYEAPQTLGLLGRLADAALSLLVRRKVRAQFGGRLKAMVSGGAPLNYDIALFFTALGLRILQGYGQTESAPVISVNPPDGNRIETVGRPLAGVEVRIADDGEILVRGELVMQGYWGDPEGTAQALRDGWLHTGDVGTIDADGYLRITDRKKDLIVNSGGENVSPQRIEGMLTLQPEIAQAMVFGDRRPHLVALIVPDAAFMHDWLRTNGNRADVATLAGNDRFREAISDAVERVNRQVSVIERVRRFTLAEEPFTIENDMMTPTLKIRRHAILARYGDRLQALYAGQGGDAGRL